MNKLGKLLLACLLCLGLVVGLVWLVQSLTQAAMTRPEYHVLAPTRPPPPAVQATVISTKARYRLRTG